MAKDSYGIGDFGSHYFGDAFFDVDVNLSRPITAENAPAAREVGLASNPMDHQGRALAAAIKEGVSRVELSWMGRGKGSRESATGESFGKLEREEIRNLAKINKIETSTHASPNVMQISGFSERGFSEMQREGALREIKKAVDFAAEASTGGAVVVHLQEWQRPIEPAFGNHGQKDTFKHFSGELVKKEIESDVTGEKINQYGDAQVMFIDEETGKFQAITRDLELMEPIIKKTEYDEEKGLLQYKYDKESNDTPVVKKFRYDDIVKLEMQMNDKSVDKSGTFEGYRKYMKNNLDDLNGRWDQIMNEFKDTGDERKRDDQIVLFHFMKKEADKAYDQFLQVDSQLADFESNEEHYNDALEKAKQGSDEKRVNEIQNRIAELNRRKEQYQDYKNRSWAQFKQALDQSVKLKPMENYGARMAAKTVSEAAVYAWERSQNNAGLDKDLFISPESWMPEYYGGHPDEMMHVIDVARDQFAQKMENRLGKEEAKKAAEKSIRATLDIGHLNTWRNFLTRKDGESVEDYDKRFNKWAVKKSEEMAEQGYLGHAHLSDNFGFNDEHLSVGQGNAPITEFVDKLKKHGVDEFIVERGSYNIESGLKEAWHHLGVRNFGLKYMSPGAGPSAAPGYFGNMYNSHLGHTRKPSYVFGRTIPNTGSEKWNGWAPWSGSPL